MLWWVQCIGEDSVLEKTVYISKVPIIMCFLDYILFSICFHKLGTYLLKILIGEKMPQFERNTLIGKIFINW